MTHDITVIISSYNYGCFVANAIDSVLSQTVTPGDIIVVDDGSHDETEAVSNKYGIKCIVRSKNMGVVDNYNDLLFNHIRTKRVMILAADDWINPRYLELTDNKADIVTTDMTIVGQYAKDMRGSIKKEMRDGYYIWRFNPENSNINRTNFIHGSAVYDVSMARRVGGYESRRKERVTRLEEDWMLWRKMINAGASYFYVHEPILYYRKHKLNINGVY